MEQSSVPARRSGGLPGRPDTVESLADVLERVLDKGIDIELLTIKLRLLVASVDKAKEMGIDWWESDASLNAESRRLQNENRELRERLNRLEERLELQTPGTEEARRSE
jgi:hypothetical protein